VPRNSFALSQWIVRTFPQQRPLSLHADAGEPSLLGQYRMRNCKPSRKGARLLQIDSEPEHHTAVNIDDDGQPRSLDWLTMLFVDHDNVHGSMVDLGDG
jgi:hypothetical protein